MNVDFKHCSKVIYVRERISVRNLLESHLGFYSFVNSKEYICAFPYPLCCLSNVLMPIPNINIQFSNYLIPY